MRTEIKFRAKSQSICRDACGTVRTGACGEPFFGKYRCNYESDCTSRKYCICSVSVFCKKTTIQKQVYQKTISFRARSRLVTSTSGHDTPKPGTEDAPDYGTPGTPDSEPRTPSAPEPDRPEPGTADTPEHWMPNTPDQKTISFRARSRLVPRVTSTSEHDTPEPGTEDIPDYGTPDTPDPEPGTPIAPEPERPEPGTTDTLEHWMPDTPDPETETPTTPEPKLGKRKKLFKDLKSVLSLGISTTPEPDTPEPVAPTNTEPDRPDPGARTTLEPGTPEQEDNKTKPKLGKRKKLFKAFRSMLSLGISTTPEPDTPEPGAPTTPEPDRPKHGKPTAPEPGTTETPEQEDNK